MNRRGFIRSALAAAFGAAAGAVLPRTDVAKTLHTMTELPTMPAALLNFKILEDPECPEDVMYFVPANFKWKVSK